MKLTKRLFLTFSLLAVVVLATSCNKERKPLTPKEVAKEFLTALQHLDYNTAQLHATEKSAQMLNMLKQASNGQEANPKPFKILRDSAINDSKVKVFFIAIKQEGDTVEPEETYVNVKRDSMTKVQLLTKERDLLSSRLKEFNYADSKDSTADVKRVEKLTKKLENMEDDGKLQEIWLVDYSKESFMEDLNLDQTMGGEESGNQPIEMEMDEDDAMGESDMEGELKVAPIEEAPEQVKEEK